MLRASEGRLAGFLPGLRQRIEALVESRHGERNADPFFGRLEDDVWWPFCRSSLARHETRHGRADAISFCTKLRRLRPEIVFGVALIAGFPTETETMFEHTLALVQECGLTHLHVFPFRRGLEH
jgi:hypothetical protein